MFPLGEMVKSEVRDLARESGLHIAEKGESQEICFVPDGNYSGFIDRYLDQKGRAPEIPGKGAIVNTAGDVVGSHEGIHRYTVARLPGRR